MKKVFAILLSVLLVCALATAAFAAYENSSSALTTAKTELKRGETFTVYAVLTNSEEMLLGTVALEFDETVFELTKGKCLVEEELDLGKVAVAQKAGTFLLSEAAAVTGEIFSFNMKVKEDAPIGAATINQLASIGIENGSYITATGLDLTIVCDHVFDKEVVDAQYLATEATCKAKATYFKSCSVCGVKGTETFAAGEFAAHTEVVDKAVAATCSATGKTEGKHCSVCNEVTVAQETVAKLPHTEVVDAAVAATCTAAGKTEGKHCSVCGTVTVAQETVAKLPHTEVVDAAVAATCTEAGKTEGKHCSVCGTVTVAQKVVDALGHKFDKKVVAEENKAADATCTSGTTYYLFCSVCDTKSDSETFEDGEPIAHTFDKEVVDAKFLATAATCKAKATYFKSCECGEKGTETFEAGELAEHKYGEGKITVEPTEEKAGVKVYTCEVCGDEKTEEVPYVETPATGDVLPVVVLAVLAVCGMAIVVMKKRAI